MILPDTWAKARIEREHPVRGQDAHEDQKQDDQVEVVKVFGLFEKEEVADPTIRASPRRSPRGMISTRGWW
jgi:hypothetical protein